MPKKREIKVQAAKTGERVLEVMPVVAGKVADLPVGMISRDRFLAKIQSLRENETIRNDGGEDVPFEGETKEQFILACEQGYPVIEKALDSMFEMGRFLHKVRDQLRPYKLYYVWLEFTGIPLGTARNYLQAYERYRDRLPQFAHLGIKKLLIASRLNDCVDYVEKNEKVIATQTSAEFERQVIARRKNPTEKQCSPGPQAYFYTRGGVHHMAVHGWFQIENRGIGQGTAKIVN